MADNKIQVDVVVNSGDSQEKIQSLRQEIAQLRTDIEKGARSDGGLGFVNVKGIKTDVDSAIQYMDKLQKELGTLESTYVKNVEARALAQEKAQAKIIESNQKLISQAKERNALEQQRSAYDTTSKSAKESAGVFSQLDANSAQNRELAALASQDAYYNRFSKSAKDSAGVFSQQVGFDVRPVQSYKQELALLNREQENNYRLWKQTGDLKY